MIDTETLRTQFVNDVVQQKQSLKEVLAYQGIEVEEDESLESMIERVKTVEGMPVLPYYNFCNCSITVIENALKTINFSTQKQFYRCFQPPGFNVNRIIDASALNTLSAENLDYAFSDIRQLKLGKYFLIPNVKSMVHAFGATDGGSGGTSPSTWNLDFSDVPKQVAYNVTDISYLFGGSDSKYHWSKNRSFLETRVKFFEKINFPNILKADCCIMGSGYRNNGTDNGDCSDLYMRLFKALDLSKATSVKSLFYGARKSLPPTLHMVNLKSATNIYHLFARAYFPADVFCDMSVLGLSETDIIDAEGIFWGGTVVNLKLWKSCNPNLTSFQEITDSMLGTVNLDASLFDMRYITYWGSSNYLNNTSYAGKTLTNLILGPNYGAAFTYLSANYSSYKVYLGNVKTLMPNCAVDLFEKVYDLNKRYIEELGKTQVYTQQIDLHADVIAQLTPEEIAIATNKGWTVM